MWISAFLVHYYEHLAVAKEHEENILVYWQNAKHQEPIQKHGTFDFYHPENLLLTQWILFKEDNDPESTLFRKILTTNLFVSGKKHSVVFGGTVFTDWIEYEENIIAEIVKAIKDALSFEDQLAISHKYPFNSRLTSHLGEEVKIISLRLEVNQQNDDKTTHQEASDMNDHDVLNYSVDLFEDDSFSIEDITIHKTLDLTSSSPEKICQDILTDIINKLPKNDEESDKTVQFTLNKLNVEEKAEIKLLKQCIKAKDDEIKNFKKSLTE